MKIACPECGQHYEVDSNMLDRHYRCKECKAFFLGLNAKPVKSIQFKKSDEDKTVAAAEEKQTAPTENSAAAGEEVKKDANENPTISGTVVMEPEEDKNADDYKPLKPLKFENIALIAAVVLSVIALLLVIGGNIRISMLSKEIPAAGKPSEGMQWH